MVIIHDGIEHWKWKCQRDGHKWHFSFTSAYCWPFPVMQCRICLCIRENDERRNA